MGDSNYLSAGGNTCLLTPVYRGDMKRFRLLRESIETCGIQLPHLAIVHTEDRSMLRSLAFQDQLTILTTADVLPGWLERRRLASKKEWWRPLRWLCLHPLGGWFVQMYTKMLAADYCDYETIVCIDSDMAFVRQVDASDFHSGGKTHLYRRTAGLDVEMVEWVGRSMRFLGINPCGKEACGYTYSPLPMSRRVLQSLYNFIEQRTSQPWLESVVAQPWLTEYTTYGVFAEHVDHLRHVFVKEPSLAGWCWWPADTMDIGGRLETLCSNKDVKIVGIQSNLRKDVDNYANDIRRLWNEIL